MTIAWRKVQYKRKPKNTNDKLCIIKINAKMKKFQKIYFIIIITSKNKLRWTILYPYSFDHLQRRFYFIFFLNLGSLI